MPLDILSDERLLSALREAFDLPVVHVDREAFLRRVLEKHVPHADIDSALASSPTRAGIAPQTIDVIAKDIIRQESLAATGVSALAGIPGGLAMAATIPADFFQFYLHLLRLEQKLAYLYGFSSFPGEDDQVKEDTARQLVLIIGLATQIQAGGNAVLKTAANRGVRKLIPFLQKIMAKQAAAKAVPVLGGVISGALTHTSFNAGASILKEYMRMLPSAQESIVVDNDVLEGEIS